MRPTASGTASDLPAALVSSGARRLLSERSHAASAHSALCDDAARAVLGAPDAGAAAPQIHWLHQALLLNALFLVVPPAPVSFAVGGGTGAWVGNRAGVSLGGEK
jgi:hypothetical protein